MLLTDDLDKKYADAIFRLAEREEEALRASREAAGRSETDFSKAGVLLSSSGLLADN